MAFPTLAGTRPARAGERTAAMAQPHAVTVNPLIRVTLYLFVLSIPFEMPHRTIPLEIPTLTFIVFLASTILQPSAAFRRIPAAVVCFGLYLWAFILSSWVNQIEHQGLAIRLFLNMTLMVLLLWTVFNLMAHHRILRGLLLALALACIVRAAMQVLGIGATSFAQWGGGERVSILGQNTNLSAMIMSAGLVTLVGLQASGDRNLPRFGLFTWPLAALVIFAIVQSGSRGGIACAAAGLATFTFRGRTLWVRVRNGVFAVLAIGLLTWSVLHSDLMRNRFAMVAQGQLAGREEIYPSLIEMFAERPILGWGPIDNQAEIAQRAENGLRPLRDAHNMLFEVLTTTGLVGGIPFVIGLALCARGAWRARRGRLGVLPLAMLFVAIVGTISSTWIAARIVWLAFAVALAAGAHWAAPRRPAPARYV
jgi:O-antigen ligase